MAYSKVTGLLAAVLLSGTIICSAGAVRAADKVEAPEEYLEEGEITYRLVGRR